MSSVSYSNSPICTKSNFSQRIRVEKMVEDERKKKKEKKVNEKKRRNW